jgi:hypothetical protein
MAAVRMAMLRAFRCRVPRGVLAGLVEPRRHGPVVDATGPLVSSPSDQVKQLRLRGII